MYHHTGKKLKLWKPTTEEPAEDEEAAASHARAGPLHVDGPVPEPAPSQDGEEADELDALLDQYSAEAHTQTQAALRKGSKKPGKGALPGMVRGREEGLDKPLAPDNKGFKLLQKMGYQQGQGLGKTSSGTVEPLKPEVRGARSGLGVHEVTKRRRLEEEQEQEREAAARGRQEVMSRQQYQESGKEAYARRQATANLVGAWSVCEQLEAAALVSAGLAPAADVPVPFRGLLPAPPTTRTVDLMAQLPALWVPAAEEDAATVEDAAVPVYEAEAGSSTLKSDPSSKGCKSSCVVEVFSLGEVPTSTVQEQLQTLLLFLRQHHTYCFFCGCAFEGADNMAQCCPGVTEEKH